jgi:hypothetical protein
MIGMAMTNLAMSNSVVPPRPTPTLRFAPNQAGPISFNLRASGLDSFCHAQDRLSQVNQGAVIHAVNWNNQWMLSNDPETNVHFNYVTSRLGFIVQWETDPWKERRAAWLSVRLEPSRAQRWPKE